MTSGTPYDMLIPEARQRLIRAIRRAESTCSQAQDAAWYQYRVAEVRLETARMGWPTEASIAALETAEAQAEALRRHRYQVAAETRQHQIRAAWAEARRASAGHRPTWPPHVNDLYAWDGEQIVCAPS